jgi:alpha-glucosidase
MAADLPRNYEAKLEAFQFIRDVPTDWQKSQAIAGEVGDYVVIARQERDGDDWFVGGITDESARTLTIALDFLEKGRQYQAQIYRDGGKADWLTKPYEMVIEDKTVTSESVLTLPLATSGGFAIRFEAL